MTFYEITAAVIPTLLVSIVLAAPEMLTSEPPRGLPADLRESARVWGAMATVLSVTLGEVLSLLASEAM